ncbi:TAXI family TRAP transporter solute-binding subunit [Chloroflexota bacterium]
MAEHWGGGAHLLGAALASVLKTYMDIDAAVYTYPMTETGQAVIDGDLDIAYASTLYTSESYPATGIFAGKAPLTELRELMPLSVTIIQLFVLMDSPVKTFRDLVGKRMSPGTKSMAGAIMFTKACPALGLPEFEKAFKVAYMSHAEGSAALVSGKLDCYIRGGTPPDPTFGETDLVHPLKVVGFTEEDREIIINANSGIGPITLPADYYHMTEPVTTIANPGELVCSSDFPEDLAYRLVKAVYEHNDFLGYTLASYKAFMANQETGANYFLKNSPSKFPFHKGAIRYFREAGLEFAQDRIPPEAK